MERRHPDNRLRSDGYVRGARPQKGTAASFRTKKNAKRREMWVRNDLWEALTDKASRESRSKRSVLEGLLYEYFFSGTDVPPPDDPEFKADVQSDRKGMPHGEFQHLTGKWPGRE